MKKNHGGKRQRSGRKKIADKAIQLNIYPKESVIEACGGKDRAKEIALSALIVASQNKNLDKVLKKNLAVAR